MTMNKICLAKIDVNLKEYDTPNREVLDNIDIKQFDDINLKPFEIIDQD